MEIIINCISCRRDVVVTECSTRPNRAKYCSRRCRGFTKEFYETSTFKEKMERLSIRFNELVDKKSESECWGWKGPLSTRRGYVQYFSQRPLQAHRASWMIHFGEIPNGLLVCHYCDNEICTNPNHLYLASYQTNLRDAFKTGANVKKLTCEKVREVKKLLNDNISNVEISKIYNIHPNTVSDIKHGRTWNWLQ